MLDKIFAAIGMLAVIAFMGIVMAFVREPDLWVVSITVLGIGIVFFVRDLRASNNNMERGRDGGSEN